MIYMPCLLRIALYALREEHHAEEQLQHVDDHVDVHLGHGELREVSDVLATRVESFGRRRLSLIYIYSIQAISFICTCIQT